MEIKRVFMVGLTGVSTVLQTFADLVGSDVRLSFWLLCAAVFLDCLTALWSAGLRSKIRSHTLRTKMLAKVLQYFCLGAVGFACFLLTRQHSCITMPLNLCTGIELLSIIENAICLQDIGVNLGPLAPFIGTVRRCFAVAAPVAPAAAPASDAASDPVSDEPATEEASDGQTH